VISDLGEVRDVQTLAEHRLDRPRHHRLGTHNLDRLVVLAILGLRGFGSSGGRLALGNGDCVLAGFRRGRDGGGVGGVGGVGGGLWVWHGVPGGHSGHGRPAGRRRLLLLLQLSLDLGDGQPLGLGVIVLLPEAILDRVLGFRGCLGKAELNEGISLRWVRRPRCEVVWTTSDSKMGFLHSFMFTDPIPCHTLVMPSAFRMIKHLSRAPNCSMSARRASSSSLDMFPRNSVTERLGASNKSFSPPSSRLKSER